MKFNRWTWGYVPVALVLGLIWFEFLRSGASPSVPDPRMPKTHAPGTPIDPAAVEPTPPGAAAIPIEPGPVRPDRALAIPGTQPPPAAAVIDDFFIASPPRISLDVSDASLHTVVEQLRKAFGQPSNLQVRPGNVPNQTFTIRARNATFWDILRQMEATAGIDFFLAALSGTTTDSGLVIGPGTGIHRFEERGAVILIPTQIHYVRTLGTERDPPRYILSLGTAVDPRLPVVRSYPVEVLEITDDSGRAIPVLESAAQSPTGASNYWTSTATFSPPEVRVSRIHLKAQVRFQVQLSEITATVENAAGKAGEIVALGDRRLSLAHAQHWGSQFQLQFALVNPEPQPPTINVTFADASGKSVSIQMCPGVLRSIPTAGYEAPFSLTFRTPDRLYDATVAFDLKDIPLP